MAPRLACLPGCVLACVLALAACTGAGRQDLGRHSQMVPLNSPVEGCRAYRLQLKGGFAPAVVYFRRADGSYTKDRDEAHCPKPAPAEDRIAD